MIKRLTAIAAALAIMVGCAEKGSLKTEHFESYFEQGITEDSDDTISILVELEYPVAGASPEVLTKIRNTILGYSSAKETINIEDAVNRYIKTRYENYVETNLPLYEEMQREGDSYSLDWDDYIEGYFVGQYGDIVSYRLDTYSYSGGAHGSSGVNCINIDLNTGNRVKDHDIFVEGFEATMGEILSKHLRDSFDCDKDRGSLFVTEIMPSANYCMTSKGIDYFYEEYEVGPAYMGCVKVHVPWSELTDIMK